MYSNRFLKLRGKPSLTNLQSAISVFINNIAVLAIENCLIKDLSAIFSPTLAANMDDEQLQAIAGECEEVRCEREDLRKKLEVLQSGKQILHKHIGKFSKHINLKNSPDMPHSIETYRSSSSTHADKGCATTHAHVAEAE
jgi:transcriptional regulator of NAD metabolism